MIPSSELLLLLLFEFFCDKIGSLVLSTIDGSASYSTLGRWQNA